MDTESIKLLLLAAMALVCIIFVLFSVWAWREQADINRSLAEHKRKWGGK